MPIKLKAYLTLVFSAIVLFSSCKKEAPTYWEVDNTIPLINTTLTLQDLFADSIITEAADHSYSLQFIYPLFDFGMDSILDLQIDTIKNQFSLPFIPEWSFSPNLQIYSATDDFELTGVEAELNTVILKQGILHVKVKNTISGELILKFTIPKATKDGSQFQVEAMLEPATADGPGETILSLDISGYSLNLTGTNGNSHNELHSVTQISSGPNSGNSITITNSDYVQIEIIPSDLLLSFAHGYFGQHQIATGAESLTISELDEYVQTQLSLESARAEVKLSNGFGADLRSTFYQFSGTNSHNGSDVSLNFAQAGVPQNLSRAILVADSVQASEKTFVWDQTNSNLAEFLENLPNVLEYNLTAEVNPLANISNYNDFAWENSSLKADLTIDIPLNIGINNLVLTDTNTFNIDSDLAPHDLEMLILTQNGFPAQLELGLEFTGAAGTIHLEASEFTSTPFILLPVSDSGPEWAAFRFRLNASDIEQLLQCDTLILTARFATDAYPTHHTFTSDQTLAVKVSVSGTNNILIK